MRSTEKLAKRSRHLGARTALAVACLAAVALAGCSDDEESAQESYCAAGDSLESNLGALTDLDLIAEGTEGLNTAVEQVQSDLVELRESASEAAADDVSALEQSVDDLETAISSLGGDLTSDNAAAVGASIRRVGTSAQAVLATLSDC